MKKYLPLAAFLLVACARTGGPDAVSGNPLVEEADAALMADYVTDLQIRANESGKPITDPVVLRAIDGAFVSARKLRQEARGRQEGGKRGSFYGVNGNFAAGQALLLPGALYTGYDFDVSAAPGMRVLLAQHIAPHAREELFNEPTIDLGPVRVLSGAQAYAVPALTEEEWNRYRTVAIYSEPLGRVIALAQIRETAPPAD